MNNFLSMKYYNNNPKKTRFVFCFLGVLLYRTILLNLYPMEEKEEIQISNQNISIESIDTKSVKEIFTEKERSELFWKIYFPNENQSILKEDCGD